MLSHRMRCAFERVPTYVAACSTLHNIGKLWGDTFHNDAEEMIEEEEAVGEVIGDGQQRAAGAALRNDIAAYLHAL